MPREKSKAEIDNENRARAGANALRPLSAVVRHVPLIYAKPVHDLIVDAQRAVQLSEKYRAAIVNRAKGMTDVYDVMPDFEPIGSITCLSEVVRMVSDICLTDSAAFIEGLDVAFVVNSLEPFRAKQDAF
ncbi:hypothetical protein KABACHOK_01740 [Brevundimonas phage vB_BpoS-Kabachok]|uniref:Uncharacterized protein n=1 Tax=Brevundimonas phage vB_BpoS-Kabachok TaxID=2948600 RepID=A0A9E7MP68_9CAUD|nr:hypothetical protein KABACHOK_01740 [Brevundimonas phage vB_BpoS-Kabachok]